MCLPISIKPKTGQKQNINYYYLNNFNKNQLKLNIHKHWLRILCTYTKVCGSCGKY